MAVAAVQGQGCQDCHEADIGNVAEEAPDRMAIGTAPSMGSKEGHHGGQEMVGGGSTERSKGGDEDEADSTFANSTESPTAATAEALLSKAYCHHQSRAPAALELV